MASLRVFQRDSKNDRKIITFFIDLSFEEWNTRSSRSQKQKVLLLKHCYSSLATQALLLKHCYSSLATQALLLKHCYLSIATQALLLKHWYSSIATQAVLLKYCYWSTAIQALQFHCCSQFHCTSVNFTVLQSISLYFSQFHCTSVNFTVLQSISLYFSHSQYLSSIATQALICFNFLNKLVLYKIKNICVTL